MRETVCAPGPGSTTWVDVVAPDPSELSDLAREFGFHAMSVEDCLDPWHPPKLERFNDTTFVILRVYDPTEGGKGSSVQELTRKIAIFYRADLVVTIHRADLPVVAAIRERFRSRGGEPACSQLALLGALMNGALDSFEVPLDRAEDEIDKFEEAMFSPGQPAPALFSIHRLKRQVSVIRRLFWQTHAVFQRLAPSGERTTPVLHDVRENAESYYFYADELADEINNLLAIHVALASHRTNEVMRVLTVFSAFFLPLTFLVGVWGMNFDLMPELRAPWGYPMALAVMAGISILIAWWFRRRGWLGGGRARRWEIG